MPLFNPGSNSKNVLEFVSTSVIAGNPGNSVVTAADFNDEIGQIIITNNGSTSMWVGFQNTLSPTSNVAEIKPSGVWESYVGIKDRVYILQNDTGTCAVTKLVLV